MSVADFRRYLEMDISLPSDSVHKFADQLSEHLLCTISEVRRLFLVEDMVDTLKVCLSEIKMLSMFRCMHCFT